MAASSCAITNGYSLPCRTNQGGIKAVYVATFNDTLTTFTYGTLGLANEIITIAGATSSFYTVNQRQEQGLMTFNLVPSIANGTTYFDQSVEVVIEQVDNLVSNWINVLTYIPFLLSQAISVNAAFLKIISLKLLHT